LQALPLALAQINALVTVDALHTTSVNALGNKVFTAPFATVLLALTALSVSTHLHKSGKHV
jgi:hypothetical protein